MTAVTIAIYNMSETKEEAMCNNAQNHRQQLLNHQQELERDLEAGSCADEEEEEEEEEDEEEEGEEGERGEGEGEEGGEGEGGGGGGGGVGGGGGEGETVKKPKQVIPAIYNVEPGCTALGCYSAIATVIVMILGIIALLMYSSPGNARAKNLSELLDKLNVTGKLVLPGLVREGGNSTQ